MIMRAKSSVFIATSLDGFIATKDGGLAWLDKANEAARPGEDCGYAAFSASVDVIVMGRNSFEKVLTFGQWPYAEKKVVVLSSKKIELPDHLPSSVTISSESPPQLVERLSALGAKHLYIDGGQTITRFLQADLIDEIIITLVPVILGEGRALFGALDDAVSLKFLSSTTYDFGYVQLKYGVQRRH